MKRALGSFAVIGALVTGGLVGTATPAAAQNCVTYAYKPVYDSGVNWGAFTRCSRTSQGTHRYRAAMYWDRQFPINDVLVDQVGWSQWVRAAGHQFTWADRISCSDIRLVAGSGTKQFYVKIWAEGSDGTKESDKGDNSGNIYC